MIANEMTCAHKNILHALFLIVCLKWPSDVRTGGLYKTAQGL